MAKVETVFIGSDKSKSENVRLLAYLNAHNEIFIEITEDSNEYNYGFTTLDIETAIQLVKELKKQIGYSKLNANE